MPGNNGWERATDRGQPALAVTRVCSVNVSILSTSQAANLGQGACDPACPSPHGFESLGHNTVNFQITPGRGAAKFCCTTVIAAIVNPRNSECLAVSFIPLSS